MSNPAARHPDQTSTASGEPPSPTFTGFPNRMGTASDPRLANAAPTPASLLERLRLRPARRDRFKTRPQNPADPTPNALFARLFALRAKGQRLPATSHFRHHGVNYLIKDKRSGVGQREMLHIIWSGREGALFQLGVTFGPPATADQPSSRHLANLAVDLGTPEMSRTHLTPGDWGPDDHLPARFFRELEMAVTAFAAFMDQRVAAVAARRSRGSGA